jgi:PKD repeat protein
MVELNNDDVMLNKIYNKSNTILCIGMLILSVVACQPEDAGNGNGLGDNQVKAAFTVTPVANKNNTYVVVAETPNVLGVKWDFGDGAGSSLGNFIDTVFYPDQGEYTITLTAIGRGGLMNQTSQTVTVEESDPNAGNILQGGRLEPGDEEFWNVVTIAEGASLDFIDGKAVVTGGGWGHVGMYQAVEVEANKTYQIDMVVSGKGSTDMWFEVYLGKATPVSGAEYADGGKRLALNTWAGCAKTPFSGKLSALSCDAQDNNSGRVTFDTSGTAYLYIRVGGDVIGEGGITIDNIELRGVSQ